jgi:hypothetical protein
VADSLYVMLDLPRIAANLTAAGDPMTVAQVREWLAKNDVREQRGGWWLVEEIQLGLFGDGEIIMERRAD